MDINQLSKKIENKLLKDTSIKNVKIIDNTYKHLKHNSHQKGKYHIKVEISSDSHPFYTGKQKLLDTDSKILVANC